MPNCAIWVSLILALPTTVAYAQAGLSTVQNHQQNTACNSFSGPIRAQWLHDGRNMKLLEPLTYVDPYCRSWVARAGSVVDGASIPKFAWSIIGGPFEGKYRDASVVHDVACMERSAPWEYVHLVF